VFVAWTDLMQVFSVQGSKTEEGRTAYRGYNVGPSKWEAVEVSDSNVPPASSPWQRFTSTIHLTSPAEKKRTRPKDKTQERSKCKSHVKHTKSCHKSNIGQERDPIVGYLSLRQRQWMEWWSLRRGLTRPQQMCLPMDRKMAPRNVRESQLQRVRLVN
jgi:hypothetical protein